MPTRLPRLCITLQPGTAEAIRDMAALAGTSQSSLVAEVLDGAAPTFRKAADLMRLADLARRQATEVMPVRLAKAQEHMESSLGIVQAQIDPYTLDIFQAFLEDPDDELELPGRGTRALPEASGTAAHQAAPSISSADQPPLSNRGVRFRPTEKNQSLTPRGRGVGK